MVKLKKKTSRVESFDSYPLPAKLKLEKLFKETVMNFISDVNVPVDGTDEYYTEKCEYILTIDYSSKVVTLKAYGTLQKEYRG